jgi:spermidine/putrescine transport system permease protein
MGLIMLPLVLPEIIVAVSLLVVLVQVLGLPLATWSVIAAHTLICTPFCIAILNASFSNLDPRSRRQPTTWARRAGPRSGW